MATVKRQGRGKKNGGFLFMLFGMILLVGCGGREVSPATSQRETHVEWLGNQAFRVTSSLGTSILTNPFSPGTGGRTLPSPLKPDIVLISHERPEADHVDGVDNQPVVFRGSVGTGVNNATGIRIRGIPTFRNPDVETVDGMNVVYSWQMDGMKFCFLGALQRPLTAAQASLLGTVDVVFVPVGGSLSAADRQEVIARLRPRLVIPMGPGAGGWAIGEVLRAGGNTAGFSRAALPLQTTTLHFGS